MKESPDDVAYKHLWFWEIILLAVTAIILTLVVNFLLQRGSKVAIKKVNCAVVNTCGALASVADMPPSEPKGYPDTLPGIE
jgi:hypothetical protein